MGEMGVLARMFFGPVHFPEREEFLEFQYKFLSVVMVAGALLTLLLFVGSDAEVNRIAPAHVRSMRIFTAGSLLLWWCLRGRKQWFRGVAWCYELLCLLEYISCMVFVSADQLRVFWFVINVPGVFLLLGRRAGWAVTVFSVAVLVFANPHLENPYSPNAVATYSVGMIYFSLFFHLYTNRLVSYFTRMRDSVEQLSYMASHDMLTGVLNARAYYEACDRLISAASRSGACFSVLFVDLDHFKAINDTHGHAAGDLVLKRVAATLGEQVRRSDLLGRIGGEEFSIFLPDTALEGAQAVAENIRQAVERLQPALSNGQTLRVTASIGLADNRLGGESMLAIQRQADQAMYAAKAAGRNRVSTFRQAA